MKLNYKVNQNKTYIVAVSFGPDSMCLLDLLRKEKTNLIVAHVNYHRRPESNSEQERLESFCKLHKIKIEVLDTIGLLPKGNFQKWAREIRYEFFAKLEKKYNAECVFIAHQQDDLIETYLMQKNKGNFVKYWGIAEKNIVKQAHIVRPLLLQTKKELQDYCDQNNVPYAIDSSNLENHYSRNKIRHNVVEKMNTVERKQVLVEIESKNSFRTQKVISSLSLDDFLNAKYDDVVLFISNYLNANDTHMDLSKVFILTTKEAFKSPKSNIVINLKNGFTLNKEYDEIFIVNPKNQQDYYYVINENSIINDELFEIDLSTNYQERNIKKTDFPLIIKPIKKDDEYLISGYSCKVRRLFIDWKVPPHLRNMWPGIYNKNNELIYVPRYKKEYSDTHKSKFVIKFTK